MNYLEANRYYSLLWIAPWSVAGRFSTAIELELGLGTTPLVGETQSHPKNTSMSEVLD